MLLFDIQEEFSVRMRMTEIIRWLSCGIAAPPTLAHPFLVIITQFPIQSAMLLPEYLQLNHRIMQALIGLAIMVYWPLYHALQIMVTVRVCSKLKTSWKSVVFTNKVGKNSRCFVGVFDKTIIPLALVGHHMIITNSALRASLPRNHLISNAHSWNNC